MKHVDFPTKSFSWAVIFFTVLFLLLSQHSLQADWHRKVSLQWQQQELRPALEQIARIGSFNFYLDRRVDPGLLLEMQFQNRPVREILARIAESHDLGYCEVGNIVYIGPQETAAVLPLLLALRQDELSKLPQTIGQGFAAPSDFHSDFLETPVRFFQSIAVQVGFDPKAFETLPHDLWPELTFSQVTPLELFTVLLAGFDMTFKISRNGKTLTPFPIDWEKPVSRDYPLSKQEVESRKALSSDVTVRFVRGVARVEGPLRAVALWENRDRQKMLPESSDTQAGKTDLRVPLAQRRLTGTIAENPIRLILASYAKTVEMEIAIDEESFKKKGISLDQRVSFELKNATIEEALQKCLDPVNGVFEISDDKITVRAK